MRDKEKGVVQNEWGEIFSDPGGQESVRMGRNKGEEDLSGDGNREEQHGKMEKGK